MKVVYFRNRFLTGFAAPLVILGLLGESTSSISSADGSSPSRPARVSGQAKPREAQIALTPEQRQQILQNQINRIESMLRNHESRVDGLEARVTGLLRALRRGSGSRRDSETDDKSDTAVDGIQADLAKIRNDLSRVKERLNMN